MVDMFPITLDHPQHTYRYQYPVMMLSLYPSQGRNKIFEVGMAEVCT